MRKNNRKKHTAGVSALTAVLALIVTLLLDPFGGLFEQFSLDAQLIESFQEADLSVCIFDIGQADSILIQQNDAVLMIDCGETEDAPEILSKLDALNISHIDTLVLTHPHADHIGGAKEILETIPVETVYMPVVSASTVLFEELMDCILENKIDAFAANAGMEIPFGNCTLRTLSPPQDFV